MKRNRRLLLWTAPAAVALLVLIAIALRVGFGWYLNSDSFRRKISAEVSAVLKADGEFLPLQISGAAVYSDGFAARGNGGAFFSTLRADQVRAEFNWRGVLRRAWQIDELTAQRLEVEFANTSPSTRHATGPSVPNESSRAAQAGWKLDLRKAHVEQSRWRWGTEGVNAGGVSGAALDLKPSGDSWIIAALGGKLQQSGWPDLALESAELRYTHAALFVNQSVLRNGNARIAVSGEVQFGNAAELQTELENVPVDPLLPVDWRLKLHGNVSGLAEIHAPLSDPGAMRVEGSLRLVDGHVEALPVLNQIALFTRTERFRKVVLTKASLDFIRDSRSLSAKKVFLESEGLLRIEGQFTIVRDQIDGLFAVGVTASSLQWLPGAQSRVFTVARDGYLWTPMKLSGPVAHPTEDLSSRLATAAAGEFLETPEAVARDAVKTIFDLLGGQ